jgi:hypothetical protein
VDIVPSIPIFLCENSPPNQTKGLSTEQVVGTLCRRGLWDKVDIVPSIPAPADAQHRQGVPRSGRVR